MHSSITACVWPNFPDHFKTTRCQFWQIIELPEIFAVLIYSSHTTHNTPFLRTYVLSYMPEKNIVFLAKENKTLTHIQEIPGIIFLTASHVSPLLLLRVFCHVFLHNSQVQEVHTV